MAAPEKKSYSDKLKDPRWQKRRLDIMNRDSFTCQWCFSGDKMLVVHHRYYLPKTEPWDYNDSCLITICQDCHETEHEIRPAVEQALIMACRQVGFQPHDLQCLSQAIMNTSTDTHLFFQAIGTLLSEQDITVHTNPRPQPIKGLL